MGSEDTRSSTHTPTLGSQEPRPDPGDPVAPDFGTDGPERDYTSRQLGIRLRPKHWERLLEAARMYGVRPTTMARMMIVRGTNAIYDAELRARARELRESGSE